MSTWHLKKRLHMIHVIPNMGNDATVIVCLLNTAENLFPPIYAE